MSKKYEKISLKHLELVMEKAKELLGWEEVAAGQEYHLSVRIDGKRVRVRFTNNLDNRPFRLSLAKRWANEILRKQWCLNGETIIINWNGGIHSGAHRLAGLILAELERKSKSQHYRDKYGWRGEISIPVLLVTGVDPKTADTVDLAAVRKADDVLFRRHEFKASSDKERKRLASDLARAVRLLWIRIEGKKISDAPHFPHSKMLEVLKAHPLLKDCVQWISAKDEEGQGDRIQSKLPRGTAAALMYLMAHCHTDPETWDGDKMDQTDWDKAEKFWELVATGEDMKAGDPVYELREFYNRSRKAGGSRNRDDLVTAAVKGWNAFIDGTRLTAKDMRITKAERDELPRIGGLDRAEATEPEPEPEAESPADTSSPEKSPKRKRRKRSAEKQETAA